MQFELAFASPLPTLRPYVREYVGWIDRSTAPICRREVPSATLPLIINFGSTVRERKAGTDQWQSYRTFTSGLHEAFTIVESSGPNVGLQVNFTPIGARLFYDRPLAELTNRTVELADVLEPSIEGLLAQLYDASAWEARFDMLDAEISSRIVSAHSPPAAVAWACGELVTTAGRARISDLVRHIGWSERHFAVQFRDHFGLGPKSLARMLRFARAVRALTSGHAPDLADIAQVCGYYDQAHFTRDFRAFAGTTPKALYESRFPAQAGFRSEGDGHAAAARDDEAVD